MAADVEEELSFSLQNLRCRDGARRKTDLTPERTSSSLNTLPRERETPTVRRRRARSLSPDSSSNTDPPADEGTERAIQKRLRMRLFSRFSRAADSPEAVGGAWRQYRSDPEEGAGHPTEIDALEPVASVRFCQLMSRQNAPPTYVTQEAVADLTLIGDFSKQHLLPVESAGHRELHCVSAQTVASLIRGQFGPAVEDFLIVDCRYPYEYQGGHIKGAVNLYTEFQIQEAVLQASGMLGQWAARLSEGEGPSTRKLIVFHCEFSSERGPHLCQYLRRLDRRVNAEAYPNLLYPELYLLLGGYQHFHTSHPDLCEPSGYVPMRNRAHRDQLHGFRQRRVTRQRRRRPITAQHRMTR